MERPREIPGKAGAALGSCCSVMRGLPKQELERHPNVTMIRGDFRVLRDECQVEAAAPFSSPVRRLRSPRNLLGGEQVAGSMEKMHTWEAKHHT